MTLNQEDICIVFAALPLGSLTLWQLAISSGITNLGEYFLRTLQAFRLFGEAPHPSHLLGAAFQAFYRLERCQCAPASGAEGRWMRLPVKTPISIASRDIVVGCWATPSVFDPADRALSLGQSFDRQLQPHFPLLHLLFGVSHSRSRSCVLVGLGGANNFDGYSVADLQSPQIDPSKMLVRHLLSPSRESSNG
jgi:hypothetical protein